MSVRPNIVIIIIVPKSIHIYCDTITISQKLFSHIALFSQRYLCQVGTYTFLWKFSNQHLISIMRT